MCRIVAEFGAIFLVVSGDVGGEGVVEQKFTSLSILAQIYVLSVILIFISIE